MSEIYERGQTGVHLLTKYLSARGHSVTKSDTKTFDLKVDGRYAEVKTSRLPFKKLGFVGLTDAQHTALTAGVDFSVFVVCNACDPSNIEVNEFRAADLLREQPKKESTYYWKRRQLERCRLSK